MADTIPHITLTQDWLEIYAASGIDPRTSISLENVGAETAEIHISDTEPAARPANVGANSLYPLATKYITGAQERVWMRTKAEAKLTKIQVGLNVEGVLSERPEPLITFPSLFLKFDEFSQLADSVSYALCRNRTNASLLIEQLMNFESFSQGAQDGTSSLSLTLFFNVDLTGATAGVSIGKAYANDREGTFLDITDTALNIFDLQDFDEGLNPDFLRIAGGTVTYFSAQQSTAVAIANERLILERPLVIPAGGDFVLRYQNQGIINSGTDTTTTSLFSGQFVAWPIVVLPPSTADFSTEFTDDFA